MRMPKIALAHLLLLSTLAATVGCGSDSKSAPSVDAGMDGPATPPGVDAAKVDTPKADTALGMDAGLGDTTSVDVPLRADVATADLPLALDVGADQAPLDTGAVDAPPRRDAATLDGAQASEAGARLDTSAVDSIETSMATITFRLQNTGTQTVYLRRECWTRVDVTSETDGTAYANTQFCACACVDTGCNAAVQCTPCAPADGIPIEAGKTWDVSWVARKSTMESKVGTSGSFSCVAHAPVPTGAYRVSIVLYSNQSDAATGTNGRTVQQAFTLSPADATVTVSI